MNNRRKTLQAINLAASFLHRKKSPSDVLNDKEEIFFKILSFNPILSKEIYKTVKENPSITKKKLSIELGKVLPKYGIEHDPSWFVMIPPRLALFLTNCGVLQVRRTKKGDTYRI